MLQVYLPSDNENERLYVLKVVFGEWLGIQFLTKFEPNRTNILLILPNGRQLLIEDHFFRHYPIPLSYLSKENLPVKGKIALLSEIPFLSEQDLIILFGKGKVLFVDQNIHCEIDIFATIFFMLTRWEEFVITSRDHHGRFPFSASSAHKEQFIHRPIVDEYVEILWKMLESLGINQDRKQRTYQALTTHDVDTPLQWRSSSSLIRKMGGDLLKRRSIQTAINSVSNYRSWKQGKSNDPFDTFDYLMDISEQYNLQSHFFFLCGGKTKYDRGHLPPNHPFIQHLLQRIDERGHVIGFHPSYQSYQDEKIFQAELIELQKNSPQPIKCGRQHFLRFSVPHTWCLWEKFGLQWDSSMYYAEQAGFRCGTCHEFSVFDIIDRKQLQLKEMPLIMMDVSFKIYSDEGPDKMLFAVNNLVSKTKKYNGTFCMLWHNSNINDKEWQPYFRNYRLILDSLNAA